MKHYDENDRASCDICGRVYSTGELRPVNCGTGVICEHCTETTSGLTSQCVGCVGRYLDSECNRCFDDSLVCA